MMQPESGSACSSPGSVKSPSKLSSPYFPGPTITLSPLEAFAIPALMERQGRLLAPHAGSSVPLAATHTVDTSSARESWDSSASQVKVNNSKARSGLSDDMIDS